MPHHTCVEGVCVPVSYDCGMSDADAVRLVVGAAHGPGVPYYLRRHCDGERSVETFTVA